MRTYIVTFLLSLFSSLLLTKMAIQFGNKLRLHDPAWGRKIHKSPVPRIGGISILIAFLLPLISLMFWHNKISIAWTSEKNKVIAIIGGSIVMAAIGLWDDIKGLRARWKLLGQLVVASIVYFMGIKISKISVPLLSQPFDLYWISYPVTVLWIVGMVNAINLIDGMDGLCAGITFIASISVALMSILNNSSPLIAFWMFALGGAVLGFLYYNFHPAKIFLGDGGSYFIGFTLATTSLIGSQKSSLATALLVPLLFFAIPIMDTSMAIFRRIAKGRHIFAPDDEHIHHKLLEMGISIPNAALILYMSAVFLSILAFLLMLTRGWQQIITLIFAIFILTGLLYFTKSWPFTGRMDQGWSDFINIRRTQFISLAEDFLMKMARVEKCDAFEQLVEEFMKNMNIGEIIIKDSLHDITTRFINGDVLERSKAIRATLLSFKVERGNLIFAMTWPSESPKLTVEYKISLELLALAIMMKWWEYCVKDTIDDG